MALPLYADSFRQEQLSRYPCRMDDATSAALAADLLALEQRAAAIDDDLQRLTAERQGVTRRLAGLRAYLGLDAAPAPVATGLPPGMQFVPSATEQAQAAIARSEEFTAQPLPGMVRLEMPQ